MRFDILRQIKLQIRVFKMRYFWPAALDRISDGMKVQLELYKARRDWYRDKENEIIADKCEIVINVLNYWLQEVNDVLAGNMPGENRKD